MDLRQIEYILAIEQEQSISRAAEKLYITQSALNQQLLKLEKELGVDLFERKNRQMVPTYAGQIYLETAHRMVEMKAMTYKRIQDIREKNAGEISIAFTPERGAQMFARVYPIFHERYPQIQFKIREGRSKSMEQMVLQKQVTFAYVVYVPEKRNPEFEYIDFCDEKVVLAVPASHPLAHLAGEESWKTLPQTDISLFKDDPFVMSSRDTRIRDVANTVLKKAGVKPNVIFESTNTQMQYEMVRNQVSLAFLPESYAHKDEQVVFFSIPAEAVWTRGIIYLPGTYMTKAEEYFNNLVRLESIGAIRDNSYVY